MLTRFYNCKMIKDTQLKEEELWVQNGKIVQKQKQADENIDLHGNLLAPGYIDLQINGGFGVDFTTNLMGVEKVSKELLRYGVTSFLATMISSSKETYHEQLPYFKPRQGGIHGATILGLHLEGPFLNPHQNGAHALQFIKNFEDEDLESFYGTLKSVKLITLAPEIPGAVEAIEVLKKLGIVVAAGHTEADVIQLKKGIDAGITAITHLFNAMGPFHHRDSGVIGFVFSNEDIYFSIIADGVHVNDVALKLAWKMNPKGLFLVSDAVALWGMKKKINIQQGNVDILADAKKAYVSETGRLAGGMMGLDANVRHLVTSTGCPIAYAIEAASTKPAKILGLEKKRGSLHVGNHADMIVLNHKLQVLATYIDGVCVYKDME